MESESRPGKSPMRSSREAGDARARAPRGRERVVIASKSRPVVEAGRFGAGDVPHRVVDATVTGGPLGGGQPRGKLVVVHGEGSARTTRAIYRRLRTYACLSGRRVTRIRSIRSLARTALEKKREDREGRRRPRWRRVWCGLRENDRALLRLQSLNDDPLVLDVRFDRRRARARRAREECVRGRPRAMCVLTNRGEARELLTVVVCR